MRKRLLALVLVIGCDRTAPEPAPAPSQSASAEPSAAPLNEEQKRAIIALVQSSQRDGIERRDVGAFMRIWDDDSRYVEGRREQPEKYDWSLGGAELRRAATARMKGKPDVALKLGYSHEAVTQDGERVFLRWQVDTSWRDAESGATGVNRSEERWQLRRTREGWRVVENRLWPKSSTDSRGTIVFDDAHWRAADAAVEQARTAGDDAALIDRFVDARRLPEALVVAKRVTDAHPKDPEAWHRRARIADGLRNIDEALAAYRRMKELAPASRIPAWVTETP